MFERNILYYIAIPGKLGYNNFSRNYIPEKRKFSGILCFRQQRRRRPPRHNFVVSAITFEGYKLRCSNLTNISDEFDT